MPSRFPRIPIREELSDIVFENSDGTVGVRWINYIKHMLAHPSEEQLIAHLDNENILSPSPVCHQNLGNLPTTAQLAGRYYVVVNPGRITSYIANVHHPFQILGKDDPTYPLAFTRLHDAYSFAEAADHLDPVKHNKYFVWQLQPVLFQPREDI